MTGVKDSFCLLQDEVLHADLNNVWYRYQQQLLAADEMLAQKRVSPFSVAPPNTIHQNHYAHKRLRRKKVFIFFKLWNLPVYELLWG